MKRATSSLAAAACILLAAGLAVGCATAPPSAQSRAGATGARSYSGRIAVRIDASRTQPASSNTAQFDFTGSDDAGDLRLTGILGMQVAHAWWDASGAQLDLGRGVQAYPDLQSLSKAAFGEVLPLKAWTHWLAAQPDPTEGHEPLTNPAGFEQLGWHVDTSDYASRRVLRFSRTEPSAVWVTIALQ